MIKHLVFVALLLPGLAFAATPLPAPTQTATPPSTRQTSRSSARKQMAGCQQKAVGLAGAAKQTAVQNCMHGR